VAIGLDDALLSWLVASVGDSLVHRLHGDPARAAMRKVVEEAIAGTVDEFARGLGDDSVEHLRASLLVRNMGVSDERVKVTNEADLRAALHTWTAALDHPEFGEPGYLSDLGLDPGLLADALTRRITDSIRRNGQGGGPLNPLAEWLWRHELTADVGKIKQDLGELRRMVGPPRPYGCSLPGGTQEFVGRKQVLAELARRVEGHDPAGTVVAIHAVDGMAGVGKTELALHAAHQYKYRYPDGQYFLNLNGYTEDIEPMSPYAALEELLRQAGVTSTEIPPDLPGRQARWRALMARQRALVLLDNALDVAQVRPLLAMSPGCLVLITSRTRLAGLPGAKPLPLDVLTQVDAIDLFRRLVGPDRCTNLRAVVEVVRRVGHLPLSIEILAGRMRGDPTLTVAELATDLVSATARLDETSPPGAGVRAAFEISIRRLDQSSLRAFWALGLHPGPLVGVPQFGALANLSTSHARSVLRTLAESNLVKPAPECVGQRRYEFHDLMREFAREQAELHLSEDRSVAFTRLATWYARALTVVEAVWEAVNTDEETGSEVSGLCLTGPSEARAWLVAEQANLLAFAAHGVGAADVCLRSAQKLCELRHHATARALHQAALKKYRQVSDKGGEAAALSGLGEVGRSAGDHPTACEHFLAALAIYQQAGNRVLEAETLLCLGHVALDARDYSLAVEHYHAALNILGEAGDRSGEAAALQGLGLVARSVGDYPTAKSHHLAALAIYEQIGHMAGQFSELWSLGSLAQFTGDFPDATAHFYVALAIAQQSGRRAEEAKALCSLGHVLQLIGNPQAAGEQFQGALAIFQEIADRVGENDALFGLAEATKVMGDYPTARKHYCAALANSQRTEQRAGEAFSLLGLGSVALAVGDVLHAGERFHAGLIIFQEIEDRKGEAIALYWLGQLAKECGRRGEARERWQSALEMHAQPGSVFAMGVQGALDGLGQG
jgi:tetratricopeptide (TPR) repeat protein